MARRDGGAAVFGRVAAGMMGRAAIHPAAAVFIGAAAASGRVQGVSASRRLAQRVGGVGAAFGGPGMPLGGVGVGVGAGGGVGVGGVLRSTSKPPAGVQAATHLEAIRLVRPIDEVRVWSRSGDRATLE